MNPEESLDDVELEEVALDTLEEVPAEPAAEPATMPEELAFADASQPAAPQPAGAAPTPAPQAPPAPKAVVCNHCGHNQTSGSKFCDGCGQRIDSVGSRASDTGDRVEFGPSVRTVMIGDEEWPLCGDCGTANRPTQIICRQCQAPLRKRELF